ncbi:lpha beta hydrolase [Diaporthe amygdali]|uniref:lpha beta hydrolase n=1 Tax=Phomopsis amygdali TaxID=1214568 RepID=UPI0022FDC39E|nr:lpha beta hydrolase [Diaporthe amygdali]KAJ0122089.1 lpha beta hydrolase [Diaporthe amygdali]
MSNTQTLALPDGRTLCYSIYGSTKASPGPDEPPTAFYFHSFPGSHHEGLATHEPASSQGLRIIAVSRPGYGGSTNDPARSILSFSHDVLALADHLHIQRFAVMGISGGGPYVLGCVHSIPPSRLAGAVVISGMYPASLGMGGMMLSNRVLFNLAPWAPWLVSYMFDASMGKIARDTAQPGRFRDTLAQGFKSLPDADRETAEADDGKVLDLLATSIREAFIDGPEGSTCEAILFGSPWGFDLGALPVRKGELAIYHGAKDVHIPARMAVEAVGTMQNVELTLEHDEAHISLYFRKMHEIIGEVKRMLDDGPNSAGGSD